MKKSFGTAAFLAVALPAAAQLPLATNVSATTTAAPRTLDLSKAARTFTMFNGMKVTLVHSGAEQKAVVSLELGTGEIDEPAFGPGLASLTAKILLEGTIARSAQQIERDAAALGSAITVTAGPVSTSLGGEVATENIALFVSLIGDVVRHPLLDTAGFERVRRSTLRGLDSTLLSPADRARQQWRSMIFPNQPFGSPYTFPATLSALQLGHVRNIYDDNFGASRAHLYISGMFDDETVEHATRYVFSDWKAGAPATPRQSSPVARRQFMLVDWPGAAHSTIWAGLPVMDPSSADFVKLEVANALLSSALGATSPISFGEDDGLAHHGGTAIWQRKGASYWADVTEVNADSTGAALDAMMSQIEHLRREPPSDAELERVKQVVIRRFNDLVSSRRGIVSQLAYINEHGLGEPWLAGYVTRVMAVSAEDVRAMATTYLDPARMTITVVGDRATVEPQVARFQATPPPRH